MIRYALTCDCGNETNCGVDTRSPLKPTKYVCVECTGDGSELVTYSPIPNTESSI